MGASIRPRPVSRGERAVSPTARRARRRFNSATTCESWRTHRQPRGPGEADRASIRPRPVSRGERLSPTPAPAPSEGFNSATTCESWRTQGMGAGERRPQRFNSATTCESWRTERSAAAEKRAPVASIRPRPVSRGEPEVQTGPQAGGVVASIRPRPVSRGEPSPRSANQSARPWLQFGHDL